MAIIHGERSSVMTPESVAFTRALLPTGTACVEIAAAHHHLMLDQPLAFVAAVRALLTAWSHAG
jgi:pimeloyl-ACP methyl ester carboxylesterase